jgi:hypothetical protein
VREPVVVNVMEQLPAPPESVPVHVSPVDAVTVTLPVGEGVPAGTLDPETLKLTVTGLPCTEGFGAADAIAVVLAARFTVIVVVAAAVV